MKRSPSDPGGDARAEVLITVAGAPLGETIGKVVAGEIAREPFADATGIRGYWRRTSLLENYSRSNPKSSPRLICPW